VNRCSNSRPLIPVQTNLPRSFSIKEARPAFSHDTDKGHCKLAILISTDWLAISFINRCSPIPQMLQSQANYKKQRWLTGNATVCEGTISTDGSEWSPTVKRGPNENTEQRNLRTSGSSRLSTTLEQRGARESSREATSTQSTKTPEKQRATVVNLSRHPDQPGQTSDYFTEVVEAAKISKAIRTFFLRQYVLKTASYN